MPRKSASSLPDPTDLESGELRKSADTRRRIMDATVHCLAHFGYAGTNAITVAELAKMTHSALLYHFPTRMDLIGAAIHYVTLRRIEMFEVAMSKIEPGHDTRILLKGPGTVDLCKKPEFKNLMLQSL